MRKTGVARVARGMQYCGGMTDLTQNERQDNMAPARGKPGRGEGGPRCSCGARLVRSPDNPRGRLGGDLLEYCPCEAQCGSTSTVIVEVCGHGRAYPRGDGTWLCPDCGHRWTQQGEASEYELSARYGARSTVAYNDALAGRVSL